MVQFKDVWSTLPPQQVSFFYLMYDVIIHVYTICICVLLCYCCVQTCSQLYMCWDSACPYIKMCEFGGKGHVGHRYMKKRVSK